MRTIALGSQGLVISKIGYGCMGLTTAYGTKLPDDDIVALLEKTHELGITLWDTANLYVYPDFFRLLRFSSPLVCQEEIISRAIEKVGRENIQIATKTGVELRLFPKLRIVPNGSPSFIRQQCEDSLRRLKTDYLDLFYLHRIDQTLPIEISMMEMKKLVEEGKVKYVGLSECSASTIRRAHRIHPITAVQLEYSLWCRDIETGIMPTCAELGIGVVAYSPLGRGFFGGSTGTTKKYSLTDFRANQPRFVGEAAEGNAKLLENVQKIADQKGVSTAQLTLAWVEAQGHRLNGAGIVAIPGTTKEKNLISNVGSTEIELSPEELEALEAAVPKEAVSGTRYEEGHETWEADKNPALTPEQAAEYGIPMPDNQ
ncbi:unnamed protein product [Chondrus crispus]|uniref:NADP-dependent oxidoreductase domain-containing protein n=1 Tax=Chondrus crispus TaxID=2769 RepID=R7QEA1_CHOCR|nr:unnamed protein product [Chondrus crispus]CDF35760.1 unnamed protein product [Chondrus crispus]|eukprot:XP_005715579.1 unnamed protein product [Chondrus crispus]